MIPHNMERSAFHPDQYVAYARGMAWKVKRVKDSKRWQALAPDGSYESARTLAELAPLLATARLVAKWQGMTNAEHLADCERLENERKEQDNA